MKVFCLFPAAPLAKRRAVSNGHAELETALPETQVAITQAFEGGTVGTDDVGVERLGGRDQPGIVFAEATRRAPLKQGTPTSMGEMKALDGEPLKRMERGRFVGSALQHLFDADYRHNEPAPAQAR